MKKISKIIVCFVSTVEKHLQSSQYKDLFFDIRHTRTKYVLFRFIYKTMRKQTIPLEKVDLAFDF